MGPHIAYKFLSIDSPILKILKQPCHFHSFPVHSRIGGCDKTAKYRQQTPLNTTDICQE